MKPRTIIKWLLRFVLLAGVIAAINGDIPNQYAWFAFILYVFGMPIFIMVTRWKMVKSLYLQACHHLIKLVTGKEIYTKGMWEIDEDVELKKSKTDKQ